MTKQKIWQLIPDNSPTNALIGKSVKQPVTKLTKLATKLPKLLIAQIEQDPAKPKSYQLFTNPEVIKPLMDEIEKMGETDREVFDAHGSMFGKKLYAIKGDWAAREEADLGMIDVDTEPDTQHDGDGSAPCPDYMLAEDRLLGMTAEETDTYWQQRDEDFAREFARVGAKHSYQYSPAIGANSASPSPDETIRYTTCAIPWPPPKVPLRKALPQDGLVDKQLLREWSRDYNPVEEPEPKQERVLTHAELLQGRRLKPRRDPYEEPAKRAKPANGLLAPAKRRVTWGDARKAKAQSSYKDAHVPGLQPISAKRNTFSPGFRGIGDGKRKIDAASAAAANGLLPRQYSPTEPGSPPPDNIDFQYAYFQDPPDPDLVMTAFTLNAAEANYDSRKYPLCAPHDGSRGLAFFTFADAFLTAIATIDLRDSNETYDLYETLVGVDDSGEAAPAAPLPTSGVAVRRRAKRLKWAFSHLYKHITDDALRRMITNEAHNDGRAAWRIIQRECDQPITELELEEMRQNVRGMTIAHSVGYTEYSVSRFRRALVDENSKIPVPADRITENDLCVIVLNAISKASPHLAPVTDTELKAAPAARQFVYPPTHPYAGLRSLTAIVAHFDPIWRAAVQRGTIPLRAPGGPRANVAQVMATEANDGGAGFDDGGLDLRPGEALAHVAAALAESKPMRTGEVICWNCKGLGHSKAQCPSPRLERSYAAVIAQLSGMAASRGGPSTPVRVGKGRRPPPRRGGRGGGRDAGKPGVAAYLMDDGTF